MTGERVRVGKPYAFVCCTGGHGCDGWLLAVGEGKGGVVRGRGVREREKERRREIRRKDRKGKRKRKRLNRAWAQQWHVLASPPLASICRIYAQCTRLGTLLQFRTVL